MSSFLYADITPEQQVTTPNEDKPRLSKVKAFLYLASIILVKKFFSRLNASTLPVVAPTLESLNGLIKLIIASFFTILSESTVTINSPVAKCKPTYCAYLFPLFSFNLIIFILGNFFFSSTIFSQELLVLLSSTTIISLLPSASHKLFIQRCNR